MSFIGGIQSKFYRYSSSDLDVHSQLRGDCITLFIIINVAVRTEATIVVGVT